MQRKILPWLRINKIEISFLILTSIIISGFNYLNLNGPHISFIDTDDYMRILRILEFFKNFDLTNNVITRSNVPFGCELHWTCFYDFFIIIPSYILNLFLQNIKEAVVYISFFITPIVKISFILIAYKIAQKITTPYAAFIIGICFASHPLLIPYCSFGRPDHHAFIFLFTMLSMYFLVSADSQNFKKYHLELAIVSMLAIWISPETLIPLLLTDFILFIYALKNLDISKFLFKKNTIITICIFPLIFSPKGTLIEYDRISIVHFSLYAFSALFFRFLISHKDESLKNKLLKLGIIGAILVGLFLVLYPKFFYGMAADVPEIAKKYWLRRVGEMKSIFEYHEELFYSLYLLILASASVLKIKETSKKTPFQISWNIFIANAVIYTIFGAFSYRMMPPSALFSIFIIIETINSKYTQKFPRILRLAAVLTMSPFLLFLTSTFMYGENKTQQTYTKLELYEFLDKLSNKPVVILAKESFGPEILFYTKHSVVAAPYHRQTDGIMRAYYVLEAPFDEKCARKIVNLTNAKYLLKISKQPVELDAKWLKKIEMPKKFGNVYLFQVQGGEQPRA